MADAEGQVIVGLEVHCQLDTKSKLFCGCSTDYRSDGPNTHVCPICLGLPGAMPALNKRAIEYAMRVAKALNCEILEESEFSRKNYFYPDLDKAYQITQYDKPLAEGGYLEIESDEGGEKKIRITRVHVEEDPGRLVHMGNVERGKYSLVDYNRAGIPLIEIVSEPDMRSPKEARKFLNKLRATLEYLSVFDSEKEGSIRVDANISITGQRAGGSQEHHVLQGCREGAHLRGHPAEEPDPAGPEDRARDPALPRSPGRYLGRPVQGAGARLPLLPRAGPPPAPREVVGGRISSSPNCPMPGASGSLPSTACSLNHARTLTGELKLANFFEKVVASDKRGLAPLAATWIADTLIGELNYRDMSLDKVEPAAMTGLVQLLKAGTITDKSGIEVLRVMLDQRLKNEPIETPDAIVKRLNLAKTAGDTSVITAAIEEAINENPKALEDYRAGKAGALNFLVGQVMKKTRGKSDPGELNRMLAEALKKREV